MCYSAQASFTASSLLTLAGVALLAKIKDKRYFFLGSVPLIFAFQQVMEGCLWMRFEPMQLFKNIYLFFAYFFWPIWIPLSLLMVEKSKVRKKIQTILLYLGIIIGFYLSYHIPDTHVNINCQSITYQYPFDININLTFGTLLYFLVVLGPVFSSSIPYSFVFGTFLAVFGLFIFMFDAFYLTSLWCFWSAVTSLLLFFYLPFKKRRE
jgi:hypothetical protein